ncbi:MAG: hypothetical protein Q8O53_02140 [Candidatus Moranbacteria bacterium]|nr:hypothetical protein [Candidatus Moranbacteria bacterium]
MARYQLSLDTRSIAAGLTNARRKSIKKIIGSHQHAIDANERALADQQTATAARTAAVQQRQTEIFARAKRGLSSLITMSKEPMVIQMIDRALTLRRGNFIFYEARRPSGEAWDRGPKHGSGDRIAKIEFALDAIIFQAGSAAIPSDNIVIKLSHDASTTEQETLLGRLVASVHSGTNGRRALNQEQRVDEWNPEELLAHVLAECAERKHREHYLGIALENFRIGD